MTNELDRLREAMRWLLLPVPVGGEDDATAAAYEAFERLGIDPADAPAWLEMELEDWRDTGAPSSGLVAVASEYIEAGNDGLGGQDLGSSYFRLHERLTSQPLFDHASASALLSHARLMAMLTTEENLSAAQVAKLISARDSRLPISWTHTKAILHELGMAPTLSLYEVKSLFEADKMLEIEVFADASDLTCAEMVTEAGNRLGFPDDLFEPLITLLPPGTTPYGPYLQMLHFQCVIAEHYDHALSAIYEFTPRGQTPDWLFAQYPSTLEVAGNPFLNNAKSVDELNQEWARSKKPAQIHQAHALVAVIQGLDSMGFAARRELAAWLRRLLVRRIRLAQGSEVRLLDQLLTPDVNALMGALESGETGTRGILEQRVVDAVALLQHPAPRWIARGLLDSVNATNVSKLKCGDCDFQDTENRCVVAYEAHAGKLTDVYVKGHIRTLETVLKRRTQEWEENVGSGPQWKVIVIFAAHELRIIELPELEIEGVSVKIEATDYRTFFEGIDWSAPHAQESINRFVRDPIAEARTPDSVRRILVQSLNS